MTAGPRRMVPLRAGPGRKSSSWRAACFLLAWGLLVLLWPLLLPEVLSVSSLSRIGIALVVLGVLVSVPYGLEWYRGRTAEPPPPPERELVEVREIEGSGGSTYVVLAPPPVAAPAATASAERSVRVREVGPGWYVAYMIFWRAPVTFGDLLLTGFWNVIGKLQGRAEERYPLRSTPFDGTFDLSDSEDRPTGQF